MLAEESVETWVDAFDSVDSIPVKVELEFPLKTYTWTGYMHLESLESGVANAGRATLNVSMQSDGEMVRTVTPVTP